MTVRAALVAGTATSLAVTAVWSFTATLTIGPSLAPHLTRNLPGDYAALSAAATGSSPVALFAVTAVIYAVCLLLSGLRACGKTRREAARDLELDRAEDAEAVPVSGRVLAMTLSKPAPWHSFTILGSVRKVRMVRQYGGQRGTVWRDYENERGQVICVPAKGPDGKRAAAEKHTAWTAANRFAGNL